MNENLKVPEGWKRAKLGVVLIENPKSSFKVEDADNEGYYPFFTSGDEVLRHSQFLVDGENIFISTGGTAYVSYYNGKAAYSADTYSVRSKINSRFLYYSLYKKLNHITFRYFIGSGLEHLQKQDFKDNFEIVFPENPAEQRKIAEILETVDNAIEKTNKIIEKYKRIKQGLMQDLLTKGIDENGNIRSERTHKFKDSPVGRIPEEWEVERLGDVINLNPDKLYFEKGKIINYIDIESVEESKIQNIEIFKIEEAPSRAQRVVKTRDVIVSTVRPNLKAFTIIPPQFDGYVCSTGFAVLRAKSQVDSRFLFYTVWHDDIFLNQVLPLVVGSNYPAVNSADLLNIVIPFPSFSEQRRIAEILSQIDETIEKEEQYKQKLERLKKGLMEDLLTGKVRVNHLITEAENVCKT